MLLLPSKFGGAEVPENTVFVPAWVVEQKTSIDRVVGSLVQEGKVVEYTAVPRYQGSSFVPNAIAITASNPGSFTGKISIWGDGLRQ